MTPSSCSSCALGAFLSVLLAAVLPAQNLVHTADSDRGLDYGVWASDGATYKASFHDGATFVPFLGSEYPHNQTWKWTTTSVRVGSAELVRHEPALRFEHERAEYDLGAVVEAYDVRDDGLEQTFVLAERPAGEGDLIVQGVVRSATSGEPVAARHQELRFVDDNGNHLITYGAATAVDANGATRQMTTAFDGEQITLRLDAEWLRDAAFPLVVDPVISGTSFLLGESRADIDVARDCEDVFGATWTCYTIWASAIDRDVFAFTFSQVGYPGSKVFEDLSTSWSSQLPRIAYNAAADDYVIVFERYFPSLQVSGVRYHLHDRDTISLLTNVQAIPSSDNAWRADVGGTDVGFAGPEVLVVFQQEPNSGPFVTTSSSDIYGCTINCDTTAAGTPFAIAAPALADCERPSINQVARGGLNEEWLVCYQSRGVFPVGDDWDIVAHTVDAGGAVSSSLVIDSASPDHKLAPKVAGNGGRYLVAFTAAPTALLPPAPASFSGTQMRVARVDWPNGAATGSVPHGVVTLTARSTPRLQLGGLAFNRYSDSHWLLTYRDSETNFLTATSVGYRGRALRVEAFSSPTVGGTATTIPAAVTYNEFADRFHLAYAVNDSSSIFSGLVKVAQWVYAAVTPAGTSGNGCSPASIEWIGSQQIGNEFGRARVAGAAPDSLHLAALATATASAPLDGLGLFGIGCELLVPASGPDYLGLFGLQIGATVEYPLPLRESVNNTTLYFQGLHTVGGGNLDFLTTERLAVEIVR